MLEREVKLAVGDTFVIPDLDDAVPGARLDAVEERPLRDVYHDTTDFRLVRWGCTLRFRDGIGWTAKIPVPATGRVLTREELTFTGAPDRVPPAVLALVRPLTRGRNVVEAARFDTVRLTRTWRTGGGVKLVELADDRVQAGRPDGESHCWRELEVELAPHADPNVLAPIVHRLESVGALDGGNVPKLARAIGDPALAAPDVVEIPLPSQPTARAVIQAGMARAVTRLLLHLPAARLGRDIEGVHQARVATRRLRSDLRAFKPLLDPQWVHGLEQELRWLADDLGKVRDADVLLARLRATIDTDPALQTAGSGDVVAALEEQRRRANRLLLDHLDQERADRLFEDLVRAAADPQTTPEADDLAVDRLRGLVRKRWRRLERAVEALGPEPSIDDLHRIRILAKRARYTAEAVVPAFGPPAEALAKALAGVQDVLGELNDAAVADDRLMGVAEAAPGPTASAAGRLARAITSGASQHRHGWEEHYRKAASSKRQAWLR